MLLVTDIGNTNVVLGIYDDDKLLKTWRLSTHRHNTRDEYSIFIRSLLKDSEITPDQISDACICSVVPSLTPSFIAIFEHDFAVTPVVVRPGIKTGLVILYEPPQDVGADRIVNSLAGYKKFGGPLVIVDFGTATTFDVVSAKGEYLGGLITPGPGVSAEALAIRAARLPSVDIRKPRDVIGRNTIDAIRSGLYHGHIGACDHIIEKIISKFDEKPKIIATGGLADIIKEDSKYITEIYPHLTLEGLRIIYEMNS
ncbi:MAG: type III pantothenate kinase [Acidobacteria bacterium]|nr:type III pantothenate kinase [Acidobacteriota bacterium]